MSYNIYDITPPEAAETIGRSIANRESCAYFQDFNYNHMYAYVPDSWDHQDLYSQYGITGYRMFYDSEEGGGVTIVAPGDMSFLVMRPFDANDSLSEYMVGNLVSYMSNIFDNVVIDKNDILINGKKSLCTAGNIINDMAIFMCTASFVDNSELINILCPPRHGKVPQPIDNTKVSREELKAAIVLCLQ